METAAQAMLNDLDADQLREDIIKPTIITGVDVIPASIDDGFIASQWNDLVREHLPDRLPLKCCARRLLIVSAQITISYLLILVLISMPLC